MANTVTVQILANVQNMVNGVQQANTRLSGLQESVGRVTGALKGMVAGFVGFKAVDFLKDSISAASDLNETVSKSNTIFGQNAGAINAWAQDAAKSMGMSRQEALAGAAQFGNFFQQIGIGGQQAVKMSQGFVQMATDLGSFNNAAPTDVMEALQGATRGEYDALQRYIPTINAAAVQNEAMKESGVKNAAALTDQQKAAALYTLAQKGMGAAQGDFARTSDGLANKQRILAAKFEDAKAAIGNALLPAMTAMVGFVTDKVLPALGQLYNWFHDNVIPVLKEVGGFISDNSTLFGALATALGVVVAALLIYQGAMATWSALTKAWGAVQLAFNAIMALNPFVLIIIGIAALVAALIYAWQHSETFRDIVMGVWNAIKTAVGAVLDWFTGTLWPGILKVYNWLKDGVTSVKDWFVGRWNDILNFVRGVPGAIMGFFSSIGGWFSNLWSNIKNFAVDAWNGLIGFLRGLPGQILGVFANAGSWLLNIGKNIVEGLWNGIKSMGGWILGKITGWAKSMIPGPIAKVLGIASPSRLMAQYGKFVVQGLAMGIGDNTGLASSASSNLAKSVANGFGSPALSAGFGGQSAGGGTIIINAGLGTDPTELENAVVRAVKGYSNRNGGDWIARMS